MGDLTVAGEATRKLDDLGLSGSSLVASVRYQHYRYFIDEGYSRVAPPTCSTATRRWPSTTRWSTARRAASSVRHRGLELEATGQVTRAWQVKGGLALLDPKVTDDPNNPVNDGETRPWLPRITADLFTSYAFANGVSIAGGMRHEGSVRTYDRSSALATPALNAYTLFDAALGYTVGKWHAQLNLKNLADKHYRISTPIFQSLSAGLLPGEPRSFAVSLRRDL